MAKTYSAGIATAYGAAKRGGYTGTYEDFCHEQAEFAENAQQVAEDREAVENLATQFENTTVPQAITAVQQEAATHVGNVNTAGAAQVQRVQEEGTAQVGRVQIAVTEQMDRAELAANNALTSERNAADSASAASESEFNAEASKIAAAQSAAQAQETVDGALSAINTAKEAALDAVESAEDDAVQAVQTEGATQTANAKTQAEAAALSATAAAGSASTASTKAGEAADSAVAAANSATDAEADKDAAEAAQAAAEAAAQSVSESTAQIAQNTADIADLQADKYKAYPTDTASGHVAPFPDGADNVPMKGVVCEINPVQSGSGDPSPYNMRPISGFTGLTVYDDPKYGGTINFNQLVRNGNFSEGNSGLSSWATYNGIAVVNDGVMKYTVSEISAQPFRQGLNSQAYFEGKNHVYYFALSHRASKTGLRIRYSYVASSVGAFPETSLTWVRSEGIGKIRDSDAGTSKWIALTLTSNLSGTNNPAVGDWFEAKDCICFDLTQMFGATIADHIYALEQETAGAGAAWVKNLFPHGYYAYNEGADTCVSAANGDPYRTVSVSWQSEAGTVYGGTLDVVTGVLTVNKVRLDLGTMAWRWVPSIQQFMMQSGVTNFAPTSSNTVASDMVCDSYKVVPYNYKADGTLFVPVDGNQLRIIDSRFNEDAVALRQALSGVYVVYRVTNPQTYQLDPVTVTSLLGTNNIWHDANGATTATYHADTKLYIDKKIAALAAAMN